MKPDQQTAGAASAPKHQIFISYQREDQQVAARLVEVLESSTGWNVWWDPEIRTGEDFEAAIREAIDAASCVLVLWSRGSVKSEFVRDEARLGMEQDKLLQVKIEQGVEVPLGFGSRQAIEILDWQRLEESPQFDKLITDVGVRLGKPVPSREPPPRPWPERLRPFLAAGVPAVLLAAAAIFVASLGQLPIVEYRPGQSTSEGDPKVASFHVQNVSGTTFTQVALVILLDGGMAEDAETLPTRPAHDGDDPPESKGESTRHPIDVFNPGDRFELVVEYSGGGLDDEPLQARDSTPPMQLERRSPKTLLIKYRYLLAVLLAVAAILAAAPPRRWRRAG